MGRLEYKNMGFHETYYGQDRAYIHNGFQMHAVDYNGNNIDILCSHMMYDYGTKEYPVYYAFVNRRAVDYDAIKDKAYIAKKKCGFKPIPYPFTCLQEAIDSAELVSKRIKKK